MKKIFYALTAFIFVTTACNTSKTEDTQAGVYKMEKSITNDGKKDTVENSPNQVKIYTATHYVFAKLNATFVFTNAEFAYTPAVTALSSAVDAFVVAVFACV